MRRRTFLEVTTLTGAAGALGVLPGCWRRPFSERGLRRVHDLLQGYVHRGEVPGLVWGVRRGGETHVEALGTRAIGGPPVRRDSIFRIASMTKPITAVATLMLVEEGKLRLDEPVDRLLPELANRRVLRTLEGPLTDTVPASRPIAVRELLDFTFGFGLVFPFDTYPIQKAADALGVGTGPPAPQAVPPPDEWMRRLGTLPLMAQPGERWLYNTGSDVLGVLIARAAGRPLDAFFAERIFDPLGMKDTAFSVPAAKLERFTASYMVNEQSGALDLYDPIAGTQWGQPPPFPSGGAGLVSTVDDFFTFAQMLLDGGRVRGRRLLSEASVAAMTSDQLTPAQKAVSTIYPGSFETRSWGLGVSMITAPDEVSPDPGRYGWDGGLGTYWFNDPTRDFTGLLLTQRSLGPGAPDQEFWKAVYQAMED